jgi:DNA-directed RNA polymerase subunit RPC12/RpoP
MPAKIISVMYSACQYCGRRVPGVERECSRTRYPWNGEGKDPNRDVYLCRDCAKDHHEHWDDRWADYYSGLM